MQTLCLIFNQRDVRVLDLDVTGRKLLEAEAISLHRTSIGAAYEASRANAVRMDAKTEFAVKRA